jgi:hypothetical protein
MADIYRAGGEHCRHPFDLLSTTLDRELICDGCGGAWPTGSGDAFEVLFIAAADAVVEQSTRVDRLEDFISNNFSVASCSACGTWIDGSDPKSGTKIVDLWACPRHVGVATAYLDDQAATTLALRWAIGIGLLSSTEAVDRHRWEELVSCVPDLASLAAEIGEEVNDLISVDPRILASMGIYPSQDESITIETLLEALSDLLGVGAAESGPTRSLLLGIVAGADLFLREEFDPDDELGEETDELMIDDDEPPLGERERVWKAIAHYALPQLGLMRAHAYVDLHGADLPSVTTVDGDMIDELLMMTSARAAETLIGALVDVSDD